MSEAVDRAAVKRLALEIVSRVEPDDVFVVEEGFDALADDWHTAQAQNEGRFAGAGDFATFAGMIVPFLLGFLADIAKDVLKDQAKKAVGSLLDKLLARKASEDEAQRLRREIEGAISRSTFSAEQKETLRSGFAALFQGLAPPR